MFPRELQTKIVSYFIAGKNAAIATEVQAILKDIPNLIDRKELISRLRQLHSVATWFLDLDPSIAPKPLSLSKEESFRRLIFDNLNMLMQPQIPAETFRQTLRFLLSVRGVDPKQMDALIDGPIAKRIKILVRLPTVPIGGEISGEALAAPALTKPANRTGAVTCEGSYGR
jgi:hypothetical protein